MYSVFFNAIKKRLYPLFFLLPLKKVYVLCFFFIGIKKSLYILFFLKPLNKACTLFFFNVFKKNIFKPHLESVTRNHSFTSTKLYMKNSKASIISAFDRKFHAPKYLLLIPTSVFFLRFDDCKDVNPLLYGE